MQIGKALGIALALYIAASPAQAAFERMRCSFKGQGALDVVVPKTTVVRDRERRLAIKTEGSVELTPAQAAYHQDWLRRQQDYFECIKRWREQYDDDLRELSEFARAVNAEVNNFNKARGAAWAAERLALVARAHPAPHPANRFTCRPAGDGDAEFAHCLDAWITAEQKYARHQRDRLRETIDEVEQDLRREVIGPGIKLAAAEPARPATQDPLEQLFGADDTRQQRKAFSALHGRWVGGGDCSGGAGSLIWKFDTMHNLMSLAITVNGNALPVESITSFERRGDEMRWAYRFNQPDPSGSGPAVSTRGDIVARLDGADRFTIWHATQNNQAQIRDGRYLGTGQAARTFTRCR